MVKARGGDFPEPFDAHLKRFMHIPYFGWDSSRQRMMKPMLDGKTFLVLCICLFVTFAGSMPAVSQPPETRPPSPEDSPKSLLPLTAYVGAEIHTCSDVGVIERGVVLVQGGKILAVGAADLPIPERAQRMDVSGMVLAPGLIDARSVLWLNNPAADGGANDASLNILHEVDPYADDWQEVIRQGVTAVYVQPSRRGSLSGYGAVLSVHPTADGPSVLAEHVALQSSMGVGASSNRSRQQQLDRMKKVLQAAADYQKQKQEYDDYLKKKAAAKTDAKDAPQTAKESAKDQKPSTGEPDKPGGKPEQTPPKNSPSKQPDSAEKQSKSGDESGDQAAAKQSEDAKAPEKPPKKPEFDPLKERLIEVLQGRLPLRLEVHTADDWAFAAKIFEEDAFSKIQLIYEGLSDLGSSFASVVDTNAPVVLGPWLAVEPLFDPTSHSQANWGSQFGNYPGAAIVASFAGSPRGSRLLRAHAALAVRHGFSSERALKAITIDAARALGVADQIGSVAAGKRADFVCFAGQPIDPRRSSHAGRQRWGCRLPDFSAEIRSGGEGIGKR